MGSLTFTFSFLHRNNGSFRCINCREMSIFARQLDFVTLFWIVFYRYKHRILLLCLVEHNKIVRGTSDLVRSNRRAKTKKVSIDEEIVCEVRLGSYIVLAVRSPLFAWVNCYRPRRGNVSHSTAYRTDYYF